MKKIIILFSIILAIVSCAPDKNRKGSYESKIREWQSREVLCAQMRILYGGTKTQGNLWQALLQIAHKLRGTLEYVKDEGDYWQTSCQTAVRRMGDCEDLAIFSYEYILRSDLLERFPEADVRLRVIDTIEGGHMLVIIYYNDDFYELDNLFLRSGERGESVIIEFDKYTIF